MRRTVFYIVYMLCLCRDEGADSWTVVYIVHILNLSPDEGAGAMDCVLYRIYSLPEPQSKVRGVGLCSILCIFFS